MYLEKAGECLLVCLLKNAIFFIIPNNMQENSILLTYQGSSFYHKGKGKITGINIVTAKLYFLKQHNRK